MAVQGQKLLQVGAAAHEFGFAPNDRAALDQSRTHPGGAGGPRGASPRSEIERNVGSIDGPLVVLYGRVSGHGQKDDLETQLEQLQAWAKTERKGQQEFLETLFACFDVTLTMLEPREEQTPEQELTDDLQALIASFTGRLHGMRSHKQKELLQCATAVLTSP